MSPSLIELAQQHPLAGDKDEILADKLALGCFNEAFSFSQSWLIREHYIETAEFGKLLKRMCFV